MVATGTATRVSRSNSEPSDHPNFIEKQWSPGVVGVSNFFLGEIPKNDSMMNLELKISIKT